MQKKVGVVIVAFKKPDQTIRYVREELPKLDCDWRAVIVNNGSTPQECETLARQCNGMVVSHESANSCESEKIYVVHSHENLGFARGNNLGVEILSKIVTCDCYLFTNDDIYLPINFSITNLIYKLFNIQDIGIIGPRVLGRDNRDQSPHRSLISAQRQIGWHLFPWFRKSRGNRSSTSLQSNNNSPEEGYCYWVSGCFFLIKADIFHTVGGFDNDTFLYSEEVILAERLKRIGLREYFFPSQTVHHQEGSTTSDSFKNNMLQNFMVTSNCIYYRKYLKTPLPIVWLYRMLSTKG